MKTFHIAFFIILILLTSCVESNGSGNLKIVLETSQSKDTSKTIQPNDKSSNAVKYNVKGTGPGGKTFSRDSSNKSMTIEGLTMGTWTVTAVGYNSDSVSILNGTKTFVFDNSVSSVKVNLSTYSGSGALQVTVKWDSGITAPRLETRLESSSSLKTDSFDMQDGTEAWKYSVSSLYSGAYLLTVKLFSEDTLIGGWAETVHVLNNKTTTGEISFCGLQDSSSYLFYDSSFAGHFLVNNSNAPMVLEAGSSCKAEYVFEEGSVMYDTQTDWYLDGKLMVTDSKNFEFCPTTGEHVINAVFSSSSNSGSATYRFNAKIKAKKGSATLRSILESDTVKLVLANDSLIGALPDNHFIVITPGRSSMQVFTLFKNTVSVSKSITYNATDLRFTWLPLVTELYCDADMNFFAVRENSNTVHVLYFNPVKETVEPAQWKDEDLVFCDFIALPPAFIDNVTSVSLIPTENNAGMLCIFDSGSRSEEMLGIITNSSEIKSLCTSVIPLDIKPVVCSDGFGDLIGAVSAKGELKYAQIGNGALTSSWYTYSDTTLQNIRSFKFLNSRFAVSASDSGIQMYEYYNQQKLWLKRVNSSTALSCFCASSDGAFFYLADTDGNLISFKSGLTDNFGKLYTQKNPEILARLAINNNAIAGLGEDGNLYIYDISKEDSTF